MTQRETVNDEVVLSTNPGRYALGIGPDPL